MQLLDTLDTQLKTDPRLVDEEGKLKKWVALDLVRACDTDLLALLLAEPSLKDTFFQEVAGALMFKQDLFQEFLEQKTHLSNSYTQFRNRLGLTAGGKSFDQRDEVALAWPYKDTVLEGGQSKEECKREEIFFNETLARDEITQLLEPKVLTGAKVIDAKGERPFAGFTRNAEINLARGLPEDTITDNLIVKGNNLLALHSLRREFAGKVKLIYIDPPYNTGSDDFKYNDSFTHATWLTFMRNRLLVAKEMLREDGAIVIQIDDREQRYLGVLCDEFFERDNQTPICVQMSNLSGPKMAHKERKIPKIKEWLLLCTKNGGFKLNPQYIPASWDEALRSYTSFLVKGEFPDDQCAKWQVKTLKAAMSDAKVNPNEEKQSLKFKLANAHLIFRTAVNKSMDFSALPSNQISKVDKSNGASRFAYKGEEILFASDRLKRFNGQTMPVADLGDIWTDISTTGLSSEGGVDLPAGKKPEKLLSRIIEMCSSEGDLVMDFFAGSGTTGAVAQKSNRQYILVEQLDEHASLALQRLEKVMQGEKGGVSKAKAWKGGGSAIYFELKKFNQAFAERIDQAGSTEELLGIWEEVQVVPYFDYRLDLVKQDQHMDEFHALTLDEQKRHFLTLLDKNQLYVNLSYLDDKDFACTGAEKELTKGFYLTEGL